MKNQPLDPGALPPVTDDYVIPWAELADRCGAPPGWNGGPGVLLPDIAEWCRWNGVTPRHHWNGGPGLTPSDAHRVMVALVQRRHDEQADRDAYAAFVVDQQKRSLGAEREAGERAAAAHRPSSLFGAEVERQQVKQAAREAARENRPPLPTFEEWKASRGRTRRPVPAGTAS